MVTTPTENVTKGLEDVIAGTTSICTINPANESLLYRGYSATELAEHAIFEEVIHLLVEGRLPKKRELKRVVKLLVQERKLPKKLVKVLKQLPDTANPMSVLRTAVSFLGAIEDNKQYSIDETKQIAYSLMGKLPFALMTWYHVSRGQSVPKVTKTRSYAARFLQLVTGTEPDELEERIMNASLILYAEHEFNASTFSARVVTSTLSDIYSAVTAAIGALKGPLHGGANEAAMELILKFSSPEDAERGIMDMLSKKQKIMGFGHRVYKKGDSRSYVMKHYSKDLAERKNQTKLFEIAEAIEKTVKVQKGLFPNADFYSAVAYYLMGVPIPLYTPIFVLSRMSGWSAHILEQQSDNRLIRPRALYHGPQQLDYVPNDRR